MRVLITILLLTATLASQKAAQAPVKTDPTPTKKVVQVQKPKPTKQVQSTKARPHPKKAVQVEGKNWKGAFTNSKQHVEVNTSKEVKWVANNDGVMVRKVDRDNVRTGSVRYNKNGKRTSGHLQNKDHVVRFQNTKRGGLSGRYNVKLGPIRIRGFKRSK